MGQEIPFHPYHLTPHELSDEINRATKETVNSFLWQTVGVHFLRCNLVQHLVLMRFNS